MDTVYFFVRHTPFWAIPILMIAGEFAYIFWLREKKSALNTSIFLGGFCFLMIVYYYWAGGPENAVHTFMDFIGTADQYRPDV